MKMNGEIERAKESSRGGEGVSRLTGSPSVLGLPPPSVYRCPAETEGTTKLHIPPSPTLPALPNVPYSCASCLVFTNINPHVALFLVI